jgi:hypothetical protein
MEAIDKLVGLVTGDPQFLWTRVNVSILGD